MILFTLQMRRVMIRLMASQGLLGPLATVEATMGAKDKMMIAPSNTWREISFLNLPLKSHPHCSSDISKNSLFAQKKCNCGTCLEGIWEMAKPQKGYTTEFLSDFYEVRRETVVEGQGQRKVFGNIGQNPPRRSDSLSVITAQEFYHHWYLLPVTWHNVI